MIGVMPDTWGRGPGEDGQNPKGAVDAAAARDQVEPSLWRAVCHESGLHGSGRGGWKRACFQVTRWPPTSLTMYQLYKKWLWKPFDDYQALYSFSKGESGRVTYLLPTKDILRGKKQI